MALYSITLRHGIGGYKGKLDNKCWIARIVDRSDRYGFEREFEQAVAIRREHFNRERTLVDFDFMLAPGLYELSENGDRWFAIVSPDGSKLDKISETQAQEFIVANKQGENHNA